MKNKIKGILKKWNDRRVNEYIYIVDNHDKTIKEINTEDYEMICVASLIGIEDIELTEENEVVISLKDTDTEDCVDALFITERGIEA